MEALKQQTTMFKRIVVGSALFLAALTVILIHKWAMALMIFPIGVLGIREFYKMARVKQIKPSEANGIASVCVIYLAAMFLPPDYMVFVLNGLLLVTMFVFVLRKDFHISGFLDAGVTVLGYLYVGWLFSWIFCIREMPGFVTVGSFSAERGAMLVLFLILANSFSDIGGYFIGKAFGKTKLCPHISPNKTVGGSLGGIAAAMAVSALTAQYAGFSPSQGLVYGLIISIFAQMGDLWESTLKRDANVKDSGNILAGHGGILDRFDSLFVSVPVAYFLFNHIPGF